MNFWLLFVGWTSLKTTKPTVEASIDSSNSFTDSPLRGTLTITHQKGEPIGAIFFKTDEKPLETVFKQNVEVDDTVISIYTFELPAAKEGLYLLPSIAVKIKEAIYYSSSSSYEVKERSSLTKKTGSKFNGKESLTSPVVFRLEAMVKGPINLYLGERTKLQYRIFYNRNIDLSKSELPFIHPKHFKKIGDVQIKDFEESGLSIQEFTQEIEASEIGAFQLGPSLIEGYSYDIKNEKKIHQPDLLRADAPAITLQVKSFPEKSRPSSFNGALGRVKAEATLHSQSEVSIGETLDLFITLTGITNLSDLRLPPLDCQPGFGGFFQVNEFPPIAEIKGQKKTFHIELRPLTDLIQEIPPIEISSFDTKIERYVIESTQPIPLTIRSHSKPIKAAPLSTKTISQQIPLKWEKPLIEKTSSLEPLKTISSSTKSWIFTPIALLVFPASLLILSMQYFYVKRISKRLKPFTPISKKLLQEALEERENTLRSARLFEAALWNRLWEKGLVPPRSHYLRDIPKIIELDEVRAFILQLQAFEYGKDPIISFESLRKRAKEVFDQIR